MSRLHTAIIIIMCILVATLISLAPEQEWNSVYEEIGSRMQRLLDTVLHMLGIIALLKYLFSEQNKSTT
ncbi:MAG: hypothetical protein VX112_01030 [Pseudomonadota bacterium]|nr:hypothetical protein [Pseudomonadota bacterium]